MAIVNINTTVYKLVQTPVENVFTLTGGQLNTIAAANVSIADAGDYYVSDNVEGALQEVGLRINEVNDNVGFLGVRVTTAEGDITALDGRVTLAESDITALDGRVTLAESNISGIETNIENLTYYSSSLNFYSPIQTLAISAGLIAWDMAGGQRAKVTLTSNATLSNPINSNPAFIENPASFPDLEVKQDAVGGRALSFGSNFVTPVGYVAAPTTANSYTLYHFQVRSDGKLSVAYTHYAA